MGNYILQVVVFQLVFLLVYEFLLKKETFFSYNRVYLLLTPVSALVLPLLYFPVLQNVVPAEAFAMLPEVYIGAKSAPETVSLVVAPTAEANSFSWWWIFYGAGAVVNSLVFLKKYSVLKSLFGNPVIYKNKQLRIIRVADSDIACTFFNTVFLGDQLQQEEVEQIMAHEKLHVKQKHSLDLLFFELQKILFWFNPLIYIYQSRISELHEFIADAGVVKKVEKKTYYQQLLNTAFNTKDISFVNQFFNQSIIKKRIVMLQKSRSKTIAKVKYLLLVPLMLVMLTYVACSSSEIQGGQVATQENQPPPPPPGAVQSEDVTEELPKLDPNLPIPFAVVEQVPIYPGCGSLTTNEEQKECMSRNINEFVNRNFNTSLGKELGLTGINRIYVQFKVSKNGKVSSVKSRAPHPDLGAEAERVVNLLPDMKPAQHKGEDVAILYSLPITLNIAEPASKEENRKEQN